MINGLKEVEEECRALDIGFHLLFGESAKVLPDHVAKVGLDCVVTDMSPLREPRKWVDDAKKKLEKSGAAFYQVDASNIVPIWEASDKQEYAARTIRPKINRQLDEYLTEFPSVIKHPHKAKDSVKPVNWDRVFDSIDVDESVGPVKAFTPGVKAGMENLENFV